MFKKRDHQVGSLYDKNNLWSGSYCCRTSEEHRVGLVLCRFTASRLALRFRGELNHMDNYRPGAASVKKRIILQLQTFGLTADDQFGFKKKHGAPIVHLCQKSLIWESQCRFLLVYLKRNCSWNYSLGVSQFTEGTESFQTTLNPFTLCHIAAVTLVNTQQPKLIEKHRIVNVFANVKIIKKQKQFEFEKWKLNPESLRGRSSGWPELVLELSRKVTKNKRSLWLNPSQQWTVEVAASCCAGVFQLQGTTVLEWLSLWRDLKWLHRHPPSNLTEQERICKEDWRRIPKSRCEKLHHPKKTVC